MMNTFQRKTRKSPVIQEVGVGRKITQRVLSKIYPKSKAILAARAARHSQAT